MTEASKAAPATQEQPYPPPTLVPYPHQGYNGSPYPPPGAPGSFMPPFFAYPPPPDGTHPEGAPNGVPQAPYMISLPPGVVYAYPPHPQPPSYAPPAASSSTPSAASRPKRKQVKMACTNCAGACKRCDESRPCERCIKYGISDTCQDGQRKERKKGVKRGPYKRKPKGEGDAAYNGSQPPAAPAAAAAIHAVAQYPPPEGYYPIYYPPPGFIPTHPHEGQPGPDGSPPHPNGQPVLPYYLHPGAYPPFPPYPPMYHPPPGAQPAPSQPPPAQPSQTAGPNDPPQPQTVNPSDTAQKSDDSAPVSQGSTGVESSGSGKKRARTSKNGDASRKKARTSLTNVDPALRTEKEKEDEAAAQAAADVVLAAAAASAANAIAAAGLATANTSPMAIDSPGGHAAGTDGSSADGEHDKSD
ncbi:hypothetical protein D9613_009821 [Agrocybe pediades]|uniref:Zn(2)-C6 fungal-type domain-containing protein n=1 Tax=Agrocybe pediades TaxID=84607 RepID=A0A8H4QWV7_9AGAR|nr:hypothetical protein D9613_009821 [Agrocybe pediades]